MRGPTAEELALDQAHNLTYIPANFYHETFCIDEAFIQHLQKGIKEQAYNEFSSASHVLYNWNIDTHGLNGPLAKTFHLIIDAEGDGNIAAWCPRTGSEKTSNTRFEWHTENFAPQGQLRVLFLGEHIPLGFRGRDRHDLGG